jgi:FkbM family methyltransferase
MLTSTEKAEMFQRLINIELKINALQGADDPAGGPCNYTGHPDQAFGHTTFSQFGEDVIIANLFALLAVVRPTYLDIGAHHPLHVSNTALMHLRGSRGVNVEANPDLISPFHEFRSNDVTVNVGVGAKAGRLNFYRIDAFSGRNTFDKDVAEAFVREHPEFKIADTLQVDVLPLNDIVRIYCNGTYPDFLSIDVEGLDYDVLRSADFSSSRPKVICVEAVSGADKDASPRLKHLLEERGYELYTRTLGNLILLDRDFAQCVRV